jgi:hypothetical protein
MVAGVEQASASTQVAGTHIAVGLANLRRISTHSYIEARQTERLRGPEHCRVL